MADQQQGHYSFTATLQLALAAIFLCDAFIYTAIDTYLPAVFPTAGSVALSMLFGTFSLAELVSGLVLLLVQLMPQAAAMQPHHDAMVASATFLGFTLASVVFPGSLAAWQPCLYSDGYWARLQQASPSTPTVGLPGLFSPRWLSKQQHG